MKNKRIVIFLLRQMDIILNRLAYNEEWLSERGAVIFFGKPHKQIPDTVV